MEGINANIICHSLNVDPSYPPKSQKCRPMNPERYEALREEVDKLINNGFIREAHYPRWVSNPVLVVKPNRDWRTCVDFSDLNKACPKDGFSLPRIDQMVDATAGHEMLSFMDAYSGYNQIPMHPADEEHTSFITDRGPYCYKVMPFGLKNAGATYQRFISKATDKCITFFDALKGSKRFEWTPRCEEAFQGLKEHLGRPTILSKPNLDEELSLYLSVSQHAVSFVLIREEERVQLPIYYVSKKLLDAKSSYSEMERLALALMGQALADFLAEFSHRPAPTAPEGVETAQWKLYVDGASSESGLGAGVLLISPDGHKITSAVRFKFKASNNEAKYEALIAGLRLASHLKIERLSVFSDSQLIVGQVKEEYQARGEKMGAYLRKVKEELVKFKSYEILQIPRTENVNADALVKLASTRESDTLGVVPIEELERPTIEEKVKALIVQAGENWMTPLIQYLMDPQLPNNKDEAKRIRYRAVRYLLYDGLLYRRGYLTPLQRCLNNAKAQKVLQEIHEGVCGNHTGGHSLALKFDNASTRRFCDSLGIRKDFSAPIHPQSNGQVEEVNKTLKYTLKKRLDDLKGKWAEELPKVLWAYRMMSRTTTGETPFSMAYGVEAVLPIEIETPTLRTVVQNNDDNTEGMNGELDLLEEKRLDSQLRLAAYQQRAARYYNKKVRQRRFVPGDLVLKRVTQNTRPINTGSLGPTWEGPYCIKEVLRPGTYILESLDGKRIQHTWNAEQLRLYYQ
ncbi:uncharacterized protein LOC112090422 [Morus notabilis]|uniref:uncharacterized protein LOC112090422 n=1 Tax=Morus notabilis TaxID=981085 RepID=UPI000CED2756|nr:uncharacterized protein LOC112090422 [Morus notabilis]